MYFVLYAELEYPSKYIGKDPPTPQWSDRCERAGAMLLVYMLTVTHSQSSAPFIK